MKFIKKNKNIVIVAIICLVLVVLMGVAVYRMFYPSNGSVYGDRLENAPEIDNAVIEQIKNKIMDSDLVEEVNYNTNVTTMKFFIKVKDSAKLEKVQALSDIIIDTLSTKVVSFYDIEIYLTNENNSSYPSIGYHSKNAEAFSWTNNVGDENEE